MIEHTFERQEGERREEEAAVAAMAEVVSAAVAADEARYLRLVAVAELDSAGAHCYDGFTSVTSFLVARCGMGPGEANREVFLARSLGAMGYTVKMVCSGMLSVAQLEVLARARHSYPEPFAGDETALCEAVAGLDLNGTRRVVEYWCQSHSDGPLGDAEPSRVYLAKTFGGRGRLDGDLDPEATEVVDTALEALMSEMVRHSPPGGVASAAERRAEALTEMARRFLDSPATPTDHGNRPHLTVVVDWDTLVGRNPGGMCELVDGTILSPETARRLACDARLCRLLTGPHSEILDLGRTRRTVTAAQWKALTIRDRHCQFAGCRRPWSWCDAHHIIHWLHDGPTDLDNLVLICRHHHTLVHEGGWNITGPPTHLTFTRPDGTTLPRAHAPP